MEQRRYTLQQVCELELRETDFTDDRLSILLKRLSDAQTWEAIERELSQNTIRVYDLGANQVRVDATTISGHHLVSESGLFQFGHSKDDPNLPQVKVMMAMLDPLGMPVTTQVVSGQQADDGLYIPAIKQVSESLGKANLLFVGDCKMGALATRAFIQAQGHYYLSPLAEVGKTPEQLQAWIDTALSGQVTLTSIDMPSADEQRLPVRGYEVKRTLEAEVQQQFVQWQERLFIVHSSTLAAQQQQGLEKRLRVATEKLMSLTPTPGPGKRQLRDETLLVERAEAILQQHRVSKFLSYCYEYQDTPKPRYQMTQVQRHVDAIAHQQTRFGWRVYVSNAPVNRLSLTMAVLTYRDEWIAERGFHRLKGASLSIAPMFVQRDDQVTGLIHLLSLALRLLTLIEFVVRRQLQTQATSLTGLYPEQPRKLTAQPTAERLLRAFSHLTLTIIETNGQRFGHAPPLTALQQQIIQLLGLPADIYSRLVDDS